MADTSLTIPNKFQGDTKAIAAEVNANFEAVERFSNGINAELDDLRQALTTIERKPTRDMFDIYYNFSGKAPAGAFPLWTGVQITNCRTIYPDFWREALNLKKTGNLRTGTQEEYDQEVEVYGETGFFVIDELNGHVRLPKVLHFISSISDLTENAKVYKDSQQPQKGSLSGFTGHFSQVQESDNLKLEITGGDSVRGVGSGWQTGKISLRDGEIRVGDYVQPRHIKLCLYIQVANNATEIAKMDTEVIAKQLADAIAKLAGQEVEYENKLALKATEIQTDVANAQINLNEDTQAYIDEINANSSVKIAEYNQNHSAKLAEYNQNAAEKEEEINALSESAAVKAQEARDSADQAYNSEKKSAASSTEATASAQEAKANADAVASDVVEVQNSVATVQEAVDVIKGLDTNVVDKIEKFNADYEVKKTNIEESVNLAESWAEGDISSQPRGSSKYWAENAAESATRSEGVIYNRLYSCILEIPQKVNLDFDNGTMTLKAGSKIPFLTGSGAVDITVPTELTTYSYGSGSDDGYWAVTANGRDLRFATYVNTYSGETPPTASAADTIWFDTNRQKVFYATGALDFSEEISLPFCYVSRQTGKITKIKQIFNGFGFIGNACWFDQGIKVLMFNGRNTDGTLRNKEFVTGGLVWQQTSYNGALQFSIFESGSKGQILLTRPNWVFVGQKVPFEKSSIWIDPQANISRFSISTFTEWQINPLTIVGKITCDGTRITSMEINQPVSLVSQKELDDSVVHAVFSRVTNCILTAPIGIMSAAATPEDGVPRVNVHKGLTVLMPNGLRTDGTKNNLVYTVPDNLILKAFSARENIHFVLGDGGVRTYKTSEYSESDSAPDWSSKSYFLWFDKKNNVTWLKDGTNDTPKIRPLTIVGETTVSDTNVITSLRPYQVMSLATTTTAGGIPNWDRITGIPYGFSGYMSVPGALVITPANRGGASYAEITINGTFFRIGQGWSGIDNEHVSQGYFPVGPSQRIVISQASGVSIIFAPFI